MSPLRRSRAEPVVRAAGDARAPITSRMAQRRVGVDGQRCRTCSRTTCRRRDATDVSLGQAAPSVMISAKWVSSGVTVARPPSVASPAVGVVVLAGGRLRPEVGDLAGAGVVDEVDAAVGCAPEVDAREGLLDGPVAVGADPVVEPAERAEVVHPGLPGAGCRLRAVSRVPSRVLPGRRRPRRRLQREPVPVGPGVVEVHPAAGVRRVREHIGRGAQVHGLAEPVRTS